MSNTTLPPEVEYALRDIVRDHKYDLIESLTKAYRLGLAAGREDGELLDWFDAEVLNGNAWFWDYGGEIRWCREVAHVEYDKRVQESARSRLRAAIRAAKEADRG